MKLSEYNESVDLHSDALFRFACKRLLDSDLAKDIVQECYTRLWLKRNEVDHNKVISYLFTSCHHAIIDWVRKNKRLDHPEEMPMKIHRDTEVDLKEVINEDLDRLSDVQKSVLMLRDYEGSSYEEIAEITSLNESQVKVYLFRARKNEGLFGKS